MRLSILVSRYFQRSQTYITKTVVKPVVCFQSCSSPVTNTNKQLCEETKKEYISGNMVMVYDSLLAFFFLKKTPPPSSNEVATTNSINTFYTIQCIR